MLENYPLYTPKTLGIHHQAIRNFKVTHDAVEDEIDKINLKPVSTRNNLKI
jgi:hypothetical protein